MSMTIVLYTDDYCRECRERGIGWGDMLRDKESQSCHLGWRTVTNNTKEYLAYHNTAEGKSEEKHRQKSHTGWGIYSICLVHKAVCGTIRVCIHYVQFYLVCRGSLKVNFRMLCTCKMHTFSYNNVTIIM